MHLVNTIYRLLERRADTHGTRPALVDGKLTLTYKELFSAVNRLANGLLRIGLQRGQRIGIHLPRQAEEVIASLAISAAGGVFVNIHAQSSQRQVRHILEDCEAVVLVTDGVRLRKLDFIGEVRSLRYLILADNDIGLATKPDAIKWETLQGEGDSPPAHPCISKDLAALLYTSGSTGTPKGVMVSQANLMDGARIVSHYLGLHDEDRILSVPPLNFDYGLNQLLDAIWVGGTLVLQRVPMPMEIVRSIQQHRVTVLPMVAPSWVQFLRLLEESSPSLRSLRIVTNTGGKIPTSLLSRVPGTLPDVAFFLMYGLTEAFRSTYLPPEWFGKKMGAIGIPVPDNEIFIVNDSGLCGPGETGELVHRGCLVSMGYWGKPDLTTERIHSNPHLAPLIGNEAVVHSGDLVHIDDDGVIWYEGRTDEMIKCSGFRISPTEVEEVASVIENVRESVAFGVDHEDLGQVVHLAVSMDQKDYDVDSILATFRKLAPSYMVPGRLHLFTSPLPRTANGKINRPEVITVCREWMAGRAQKLEGAPH